jgi:hypothetical protein
MNSGLQVNNLGVDWKQKLSVRPGETVLHLRSDAAPVVAPGDARHMVFRIVNLSARD